MSFLRQCVAARFFISTLILSVCMWLPAGAALADEAPLYNLKYTVELRPNKGNARVTMWVDKGDVLQHLSFKVKPGVHSNITANGKLVIKDGRATWTPPAKNARLRLTVKINHERDPGKFDARMTKDWAIFRGDDIIPPMFTDTADGALSQATLRFKLPEGWSIETGWPRKSGNTFRIDNPERRFDRPVGWMIAGKLGTRRTQVGNTNVAVSAPQGESVRRMDSLTFLTFVWPQMQLAFGQTPDKLLIVGAGDPMWRGGLSASNSLFLHADRPLVSENGTSPLVHELVHMVTHISGFKGDGYSDDWIAEGLAEFYSFELIYRAGAMTSDRRQHIIARLAKWGDGVTNLRESRSTGPVTARAVILFDELDRELRTCSKNKYTIDDVVGALIPMGRVSLDDLRKTTAELLGAESEVLQSSLLDAPLKPKD
jgi:hypothetical protein